MNNAAARETMLKSQIRTGHVLSPRLLDALMAVPRERFVPPAFQGTAYVDEEIPLGAGRVLMEPLLFARMLDYASIQPHETVLAIGTCTGYSAAVLSRIARKVVAVEEDTALMLAAKILLADYPNIEAVRAPLSGGYPAGGPYDVIVIEGAIEAIPQILADQLCEEGRLLTVEHAAAARMGAAGLGKLVEFRKIRGVLCRTVLRDANAPLLAAFARPPSFVF